MPPEGSAFDVHRGGRETEWNWTAGNCADIIYQKRRTPPPVISQLAIEHGPFSSVIYLLTMVIFPSKALVYQRISCKTKRFVYGTSHRVDS